LKYYSDITRQFYETAKGCKEAEDQYKQALAENCAKLDALSPIKVLMRGYAVALQESHIVDSVKQIDFDRTVTVRLTDGQVECQPLKTVE